MRLTERASDGSHALVGQARYAKPNSTYTPSWETAYHRAIWSDHFEIHPSCPSGNCTWPTFQTLGYCSQCTDKTAEASLEFYEQPVQANVSGTGTWTLSQVVIPGAPKGGPHLPAREIYSHKNTDLMELLDAVIWSTTTSVKFTRPNGHVYGVRDVENPLFELAYAQLGTNKSLVESGADPSEALFIQNVTSCRFTLCLWEYSVSIGASALSVISQPVDYGRFFYADEFHQFVCWIPDGAPSAETSSLETETEIPSEPSPLLNTTGLRNCIIWVIRRFDFQCMHQHVQSRPINATNGTMRESRSWSKGANRNFERIQALGFELFMNRLAHSLTETLMDDSNFTIEGTIWDPEPFVEVRWRWLIPPAILVLTGTIFFIITVYTSKKEKVLPWKSSGLALLYHGLETVAADEHRYTTASRMEAMANIIDVRLAQTGLDERLVLRT
ncbi:hypothetical protein BJY04DRAFT_215724 [Aspergillus karnatakaensis]|uniref:uncharacterized protein n=1 Tax=Aspergillus karnatakaensis TaxID=1810916 RepID=UPI003CCD64AD